jgi:TATA-box binding protein (TBP) (component of TFIID and TFIIIB)
MSDSSAPNSPDPSFKFCSLCDPKKKYFNCICGENWNTFEEHLNTLKNLESPLILKPISISTMTLCCNFNSHVDLDTLANLYAESVKYSPHAKKTKETNKKDCFYNSLLMRMTIKYQVDKNKNEVSVKFFPNGKIQIAGCNSIKSCCYAIRKAYNRILNSRCFMEDSKISESKIVMINTDFKIKYNINQQILTEILSEQTIDKNLNFLQVVYQSSKYPGINAKFIIDDNLLDYAKFQLEHGFKKKYPNVISILIFRPGSIIITGGNKIYDYISAINSIIHIIDYNKAQILI